MSDEPVIPDKLLSGDWHTWYLTQGMTNWRASVLVHDCAALRPAADYLTPEDSNLVLSNIEEV